MKECLRAFAEKGVRDFQGAVDSHRSLPYRAQGLSYVRECRH